MGLADDKFAEWWWTVFVFFCFVLFVAFCFALLKNYLLWGVNGLTVPLFWVQLAGFLVAVGSIYYFVVAAAFLLWFRRRKRCFQLEFML